MHTWLIVTIAFAAVAVCLSLLLILRRLLSPPTTTPPPNSRSLNTERSESLHTGIAKLHHVNTHHQIDIEKIDKKHPNFPLFRSQNTIFSWSDHPSLITDAVENGWSRFAFTTPYTSSQSTRGSKTQSLLGACAGAKEEIDIGVDITWEVSPGYADFMQKIRLNPGLKKLNLVSVIKTGLPLPGPPESFPQEAYFEITVLKTGQGQGQFGNLRCESEKAKLIQQNSCGKVGSESMAHVISSVHGNTNTNTNNNNNNNNNNKNLVGFRIGQLSVSVGLVRGGPIPSKVPGSFPGSVGFNSDGSVYLDGLKLVLESQKQEWAKADRVIGCGYNPIQKKVYFTLDSQLVHIISCKTEEYGTPLYPTLAANTEVTVLVNFGQSAFKYTPANSQRTPNPCFIGTLAHSPTFGYEDSKELFSMGRIDSQWLNRSTTRNSVSNYGGTNNKFVIDYDEESEGDLFEIVLAEGSGKSPNMVLR